ncbi:MAG: FxLYD domain-containing protein [Candidatus Omnitrophota bacterium]|nr:zinc ribbon domain-containing protein [bacterium]MBU3929442.1 zinc ribbon domain-containing protein [bacterium]
MHEEKQCPYCGEMVKSVAKKCKHCHEWLDGGLFSKRSPLIRIALPVILFVALYQFFAVFASFKMMPCLKKKFLPKEYSDESGLKVHSHKVSKGKRNIDILGQIKNTGSETWRSVKVEAEYFDKQNTFVDTKSDYISGAVPAGEERNFKISFYGASEDPRYDHYTVKIVSARADR